MFIDEYKNSNESNYEEKDDEIIMKVKNDKENIYVKEKILYINKKTYKPVKLEIKDNKQKERDILKNNILSKYNIPLIRLTTNGSREESIIRSKLDEIVNNK